MSYTKIWIHFIWSTKNRAPLLNQQLREELFAHVRSSADAKGIILDTIGGHVDHVHALIQLKAPQSPAYIMQNLKGESSHWVNAGRLSQGKFEWQDDYYALSVSQSNVDVVRNYILRQEEHHRVRTFQEECDRILNGVSAEPT